MFTEAIEHILGNVANYLEFFLTFYWPFREIFLVFFEAVSKGCPGKFRKKEIL